MAHSESGQRLIHKSRSVDVLQRATPPPEQASVEPQPLLVDTASLRGRPRGATFPSGMPRADSAALARHAGPAEAGLSYHFVIAVLGAQTVGKTTLVVKGFKKFHITKEATRREVPEVAGLSYAVRRGHARFGDDAHAIPADITVIEVQMEDLDRGGFRGWPHYLPPVDAVFLCYDASRELSVSFIPETLGGLLLQQILTVVVACKSDLQKQVRPNVIQERIVEHSDSVGLVEVDATTKDGKHKIRCLIDWCMKVLRRRLTISQSPISGGALAWTGPPASDTSPYRRTVSRQSSAKPTRKSGLKTHELPESDSRGEGLMSPQTLHESPNKISRERNDPSSPNENNERNSVSEALRPLPLLVYQSLDGLLHRLSVTAVSGNDPSFIEHFFLTYRRFATPSSIVFGLLRRLHQVTRQGVTGNFASLKFCRLLVWWTNTYPADFAATGAVVALQAFVDATLKTSYLAPYANDLISFMNHVDSYTDSCLPWSLQTDQSCAEKSDLPPSAISNKRHADRSNEQNSSDVVSPVTQSLIPAFSIKQLREVGIKMQNNSPEAIAQEITRMQQCMFLDIQPRDWIHHVLVKQNESSRPNAIRRFLRFLEHLGNWATSLILCHETTKHRAKQLSKLVEVAKELRIHHNYAGLRCITVGVMNATYDGDKVMDVFHEWNPELAKRLASYNKLFASAKSFAAYRLAYRNVSGPIIPAIQIHIADIMRLQAVNPDFHAEDPSKIHWGKFNATGRIIVEMRDRQMKCEISKKLCFEERRDISEAIDIPVMDSESQHSRIPGPPEHQQEPFGSAPPAGFRRLTHLLR